MTCTNCGQQPLSMAYTLRFSPETRGSVELDLHLCTACLLELRADPDIELVRDPVVVAD